MAQRAASLLIVDDEPAILDILSTALRRWRPDIKVFVATSAIDGLRLIESERVDVVVSDHRMPGMSGVEFLECVQLRLPTARCVLMTAYPEIGLVLRSANCARIARFITKPFSAEAMVRTLVEVLEEGDAPVVRPSRSSAAGA